MKEPAGNDPQKPKILLVDGSKDLTPELNDKYDTHLNIQIIGDAGVGKSSLLSSFKTDDVGATFYRTKIIEQDGKRIKLQIWDRVASNAREDVYHSRTYSAMQNAFILVFSLTDDTTFNNTRNYLEEMQKGCYATTPVLLIGNMADLKKKRMVDQQAIEKFIKECPQLGGYYRETIANQSINTNDILALIAEMALEQQIVEKYPLELLDIIQDTGFWERVCGHIPRGVKEMQSLITPNSKHSSKTLDTLFNKFKAISEKRLNTFLFFDTRHQESEDLYRAFKVASSFSSIKTGSYQRLYDRWHYHRRNTTNSVKND